MKLWRKYVLCVMCVCCFGLLTGCGNRNDSGNANQNAGTDKNGTTIVTENGSAGNENGTVGSENGNSTADDNLVNDVTDQNTDSIGGNTQDNSDGVMGNVGEAGKDVIDGVGEAGKDVIDGVENAGDALSGNGTDKKETDTTEQ